MSICSKGRPVIATAPLAQLVERRSHNPEVVSSILTWSTVTELAQLEERPAFNRVVVGSSPTFGVRFLLLSSIPAAAAAASQTESSHSLYFFFSLWTSKHVQCCLTS